MSDGLNVSLLRGTTGVTERDNSDKQPIYSWQDDLKQKPLFNFAAENPSLNIQNTGASIW